MIGFWKFLDNSWTWAMFFAFTGGGAWLAKHTDRGLAGLRRRLKLETVHPELVKPICGCEHDLAFHTVETNACRFPVGGATCSCQRYTGPEVVGQSFFPRLSDPREYDGGS